MKRVEKPRVFAPDWGKYRKKFWFFLSEAKKGNIEYALNDLLAFSDDIGEDPDALRVQFSVSLLKDILNSGGWARVIDSRMFVSWPDWQGESGRHAAREAMISARDMRPLNAREIERVRPLFASDLDGEALGRILQEGRFSLVAATEKHPSGVPYTEAFSAALRYWTMPYRGRVGRMRRFVLLAEHPELGQHPVVAGILELGDDAPFCGWRDGLLGLSRGSFKAWLSNLRKDDQAVATMNGATERLRTFRSCLRPTQDGQDLGKMDAESIVNDVDAIEELAKGRSQVSHHEIDALRDRKRLAYGLRLARGEVALRQLETRGYDLQSSDLDEKLERNIGAGVRAMHDILIPRLHLEATVCGAVPPFNEGLGGKLLISFFTHPEIINATLHGERELLSWSFDIERLDPHLPKFGMLCLTTKGLYQGHAPMYNRGLAPGLSVPIRMRYLDNTGGQTTTFLSQRTAQLAKRLHDSVHGKDQRVSTVYGSGGAKRHRVIEAALIIIGIPPKVAMAGIQRPVYGMEFVSNAIEVSWLGSEPQWLIFRDEPPDTFCERAVNLWRGRWLERAKARVQEFALTPSLIRILEPQHGEENYDYGLVDN